MLGVLDGAVFGSLFDFGDQWSKCWLNTKQSVLVPFTAVGIPSYLLIGQNAQSQALIFIETSGGSDIERYTFSGITSLPPVSFPMDGFARANGIEVDLEIDLYMQLEGDNSGLHFHAGEGGGTDTLQTLQWDLQPG